MKKNLTSIFIILGILLFASCKKEDSLAPPAPEPAFTLTTISPSSGHKNTVVTISGTGFGTSTAALKVFFNGVPGTIQTATTTQITATVPAMALTGKVKVEKNGIQLEGPVFTYQVNTTASAWAGSGVYAFSDGTGTTAQFSFPTGIARDAAGNIFVADRDNHRIRKITPGGMVTTIAGSGAAGYANGTGTAAQFNQPYSITVDASGNLFVADRINHAIRKITPAGVVTTVAGNGTPGNANGTGTAAQFNEPLGIVVDGSGNLFVADYINNLIRKVTAAGVVTTFAGDGSASYLDGTGTAAAFNGPLGLAIDAANNIYVSDYRNHRIRKITPAAVVTTIAGTGVPGLNDGAAAQAQFYNPAGLVVDALGNLYIGDTNNHSVRMVTAGAQVITISGNTSSGYAEGNASGARYNFPIGVCADFANNDLIICDMQNNRIRKLHLDL